jgi:hypothetical protein
MWSVPAPAVEDEPTFGVLDADEESEREGSRAGDMWSVPAPAVQDESMAEVSEHHIEESGDSPYSRTEFVAGPEEQLHFLVDDPTESSHASAGIAPQPGASTGAAVVGASEKDDVSARTDIEAALDEPPDATKKFDFDSDALPEEAPRRKRKLADIMLILCIVAVILILVITLPVVLTNQNKNRDLPTPPVRNTSDCTWNDGDKRNLTIVWSSRLCIADNTSSQFSHSVTAWIRARGRPL